ncbi:MAG: twin-arginine translocase subunit TatB [Acidobacteria bacterium]|nr:MAG: twin-arginine translocase subunit TatB [Acidobacteriota bacterium]
MFGSIGGPEIFLILVLALIVLGPRRLPELGRALGRAVAEFRRATAEFREGVERELDLDPMRQAGREIVRARREIAELARAPARALSRELAKEAQTGQGADLAAGSIAPPMPPAETVAKNPPAEDAPACEAPPSGLDPEPSLPLE